MMRAARLKRSGKLRSICLAIAMSAMAGLSASGQTEVPAAAANQGGRPSVGLVLSGGGAKGVAHVGVIKALEDNDIPIDCIAGTSMGAVVGSLYSCGWSPERMMEFLTSSLFLNCSTGTIDPDLTYYFSRPDPTPEWVGFNLSFKKKDNSNFLGEVLPSSLINPLPMSIEFLKLFTPYTAYCRKDFDNLFVPFRCVTSDIYHKHKIVLSRGSLGDAVRASMSFPLVFKPIEMDGVLVYDGGIYDNFPVDVMEKDFNPDFMIGVSVSGPDAKPIPGNAYEQLEDMIIQNNNYSMPPERGVKIQVPVLNFGVLDFPKAPEIYRIGYETGLAMVDSIKKRTAARRSISEVRERRGRFYAEVPVVEYDSVTVSGVKTHGQERYLKFLFDRGLDRPFGMEQVQNAFYRAVGTGEIRGLLPQTDIRSYTPTPMPHQLAIGADSVRPLLSHNTLMLQADVKNPWNIGVGGWITSSTNSMLYLTFGYHTLRFNSLDVRLSGWIGQTFHAGMLSAKFTIRSRVPSYVQLQAVVSRQKYYDSELLFYQDDTPSFITNRQQFMRVGYGAALGRRGKLTADIGYGYLSDRYFPDNAGDFTKGLRDKAEYRTLALRAAAEWNTLDNEMYPSSGHFFNANIACTHEDVRLTPGDIPMSESRFSGHSSGSLEVHWKQFFGMHHNFIVGTSVHGLVTLQRLYMPYTPMLVHSYAFAPTPSTRNYFNPAFRSDNYLAAGVMPIWSPLSHVQLRGDFYVYSPIRDIADRGAAPARYDGWFRRAEFVGEVAAVYNFSFASLSLYSNYLSYPARNWNFGINFGLYFGAPRLIR